MLSELDSVLQTSISGKISICHDNQQSMRTNTPKKMGMYLNEPVFSHGQLYVACGRVGSEDHLSILVVSGRNQGTFDNFVGTYTRNVVWNEVFSNLDHEKNKQNFVEHRHELKMQCD